MAMGNNPMMMVDEDGMTWGIFKGIVNAWDWAWDKGNQFARWADENGIPSMNFGAGMNSAGQVSPLINVNGQELDLKGEAASINRGIAYAMNSFSSQRDLVKRKFPYVTVDRLIFNGAWTYDPNDWFSAHKTLEDVIFEEWYKRSSGRVEMTDSPIDYMLGAGIGKAFLNGGRKLAAKAAVKTAARGLTTADGFLFKGFTVRAPFNIPVQRFGNMSLGRPDFWGPRIGTSKFANRVFGAIKPSWNPLTQYTKGVIPKGTPIKFGVIGPQGWRYPGGSLQFITPSRGVINQFSKIIPR
jgi:hypothetical protein